MVNDDSDQLDLLEVLLEQAGYEVLKATNGSQGLRIAENDEPDLVVSDVMMPVMNGIELCRRIRELPNLQRVPVLLVSALRVDSESAVEGFRAGADDYLEIPFEQSRFIAKVERLFERKREEEAHIQLIKAHNALRESRTELAYVRFALDEATIVTITDNDGRITYFNDKFCEITGYGRDEIRNQTYDLINSGFHPEEFFNEMWRTIRLGNVWKGAIKNRSKDGSEFWIDMTIVPVLGDDRKPRKFISISHDITESKLASERIERSEVYYRALIENATDLVSILSPDGKMLYQSPSITRVLGYENEELVGGGAFDFVHPDDVEKARKAVETVALHPDEHVALEVRFRHKQGHWAHFQCSLTNLIDNFAIRGIVTNAFDISDRIKAEEALRDSELRYRILFDNNPMPMWVVDSETLRFLAVNNAAVRHYGYSQMEFREMRADELLAPEDSYSVEPLPDGIDQKPGAVFEKHIRKDCTLIDTEITRHALQFDGRPAELVLINDITEKLWAEKALRQSEEQLRQAQKLESVGRLAGGIAHDFNNMLTAINGYSDLLLAQLEPGNPLRRNVEEIKKAGVRSAELTRQLLAFSRRQILQPKIIDLNKVINDTTVMLQRLIGEDIQLIAALNPDIGMIEADPGQIAQVLLNLTVNSRDAMPNGGTIVIETESVRLDEHYVGRHRAVRAGNYVMLAVSDTGFGMSEEIQQQVFEPFFTTKDPGKGTGLGMSTVYGIVKQSGGNIWVYSEPRKGTTVKVYLPLISEHDQTPEDSGEKDDLMRGTETILLVEDEEVVRRLSREVLELCGYKVIEAENGIAALSLCERFDGHIHLLMTDVVMPKMGGRELAQILQEAYPQMAVLFTSGYTDDAIIRHGILNDGANFIQKPFTFENLTRKVREMLDGIGSDLSL